MHPYRNKPRQSFWRQFVSDTPWAEIDLVGQTKFVIAPGARVSMAGSCFAQHIGRHLRLRGLQPFQVETAHPWVREAGGEVDSYEAFPARFGNVYTSRQCLELFQQAIGEREVIDDHVEESGRFHDLLRPNAVPGGFGSLEEALADRHFHLRCVRRMFEASDVFIFTLGLTESWFNARSGHTYPVCPGTVRGRFAPELHQFRNLSHAQVVADLEALIEGLRRVNPGLRLIFTVSPVPLVATQTNQNVLTASVYSKSVLRAACGEVEQRHDHVQYFPSYEIISHPASFGQYLASDLREVTERGVSHVMRVFFRTFFPATSTDVPASLPIAVPDAPASSDASGNIRKLLEADCEEMFNDYDAAKHPKTNRKEQD